MSDAVARRPGFGITFYNCLNSARLADALTDVALVVLLVAVAIAIYRLYPWLITRAASTRPLAELGDAVPDAVRVLVARTASEADRPTEVLVAVGRPGTGARALGCFPRYRVLIDMGLITAAGREDGRLRAILAHELAHVGNRDIDITYLTTAFWWAFLMVEVPLSLVAGVRLPRSLLAESWRFAVILAVIWLVRSSVLRTREFYADLSAARDPEAAGPLRQVLERARSRGAGPLSAVIRAAAYHPGPRARLAILDDPSPLSRVWVADSLAAGFLIGFAYSPVNELIVLLGVPYSWRGVVLGVLVGLPVAGALAASLWHQTYQQLSLGQRPHGAWRCSVFLTTGIIAGQFVTPPLAGVNELAGILRTKPLEGLTLIVLLYLVSYVVFEWIILCAASWLTATRSVRLSYRIGTAITVLVAGVWLAYWFTAQSLLLAAGNPWQVLELLGKAIPLQPYLQISLALAIAYPAAAWPRLRRHRVGTGAPSRSVAVPVPAALALSVVIMVAATFVPLGFHDYLAAASSAARDLHDGVIAELAVLKIFAVIVAVAGLAAGALLGGRGATRQAVAAAGLAALVAAPYVAWMTGFQWIYAWSGWKVALTYVSNGPVDLTNSESIFGWWLTDLVAAAMAAAVIGAGIGAGIRAAPRAGRTPAPAALSTASRRPVPGIAGVLPGLAVVAAVTGTGLQSMLGIGYAAATAPASGSSSPVQIIRAALPSFRRPGSLPVPTACQYVSITHNSVLNGNLVDPDEIGVMDALTAAAAYASDNYVLAELGRSIVVAMAQDDENQATELTDTADDYCERLG